jgi:hypothetical protein
MHGSISDTAVSDLVAKIYISKRSGVLRLTQGEIKKNIYFIDGGIVFAHSNLRTERLGEILFRLGKITEEEFRMVTSEIDQGKRIGQVLLDKGFIAPSEVRSGVAYQVQQILYSVLNWDSGEYEFQEKDNPVFDDIKVEVSTPIILIDGIRNISNPVVLERVISQNDSALVEFGSAEDKRIRLHMDFAEETIFSCIDDHSTVGRLRSITHLSPVEFNRALYSLILSGVARLRKEGVDLWRQRIVGMGNEVGLVTERMKPMGPAMTQPMTPEKPKTMNEDEVRQMVKTTEQNFRNMQDEEILNVFPDSTEQEIQAAYNRLAETYCPLYYSEDRYLDLKNELKFIVARLTSAYHKLMERAASQLPLEESPVPPDRNFSEISGQPTRSLLTESGEMKLKELLELIKGDPDNAVLLMQAGKKLQLAGRAREGEKHLLHALQLNPQSVDAHLALAEFYQLQGLKFKAFKHLNTILQFQPDNQRALEMLGIQKRKKSMYEISPSRN